MGKSCPTCKTENPLAATYCARCGTRLGSQPVDEARQLELRKLKAEAEKAEADAAEARRREAAEKEQAEAQAAAKAKAKKAKENSDTLTGCFAMLVALAVVIWVVMAKGCL